MVIWIIGLSGTGKTTLAQETVRLAKERISNVVLVDGDLIREVWGNDLCHTLNDRRRNAERICRLCRYLDSQAIHVVCSILSIFGETRDWNRCNIANYYEIYIRAHLADLEKRDPKNLYARAHRGEIELPGVNMNFPEPVRPDLVVDNYGTREELLACAPTLAALLH